MGPGRGGMGPGMGPGARRFGNGRALVMVALTPEFIQLIEARAR
jgi:hypothetical protein